MGTQCARIAWLRQLRLQTRPTGEQALARCIFPIPRKHIEARATHCAKK